MTATGPAELFEQVQADSTNITIMAKSSKSEGESCSSELSENAASIASCTQMQHNDEVAREGC
jgi:hypothetical protein